MAGRLYNKTYIREWREWRGLSLRRLASRLEDRPGGEELVSYASLSRIEQGKQPYSQPIIEAIAVALDVSVSALLSVNPTKDGDVIDAISHLSPEKRRQALAVINALAKAS